MKIMCGRFTLKTKIQKIAKEFDIFDFVEAEPEYNIAPSRKILVLLKDEKFYFDKFRWGLIPQWIKEINSNLNLINARVETLHEKPAYKNLLDKKRCIILTDGFYEWKKGGDKKNPYYIKLKSGDFFGFAGLWDIWSGDNNIIKSCTIITTEANELMKSVHNRMPVILTKKNIKNWLSLNIPYKSILTPYNSDEMELYPVSNYVNSPKNAFPECILKYKIDLLQKDSDFLF